MTAKPDERATVSSLRSPFALYLPLYFFPSSLALLGWIDSSILCVSSVLNELSHQLEVRRARQAASQQTSCAKAAGKPAGRLVGAAPARRAAVRLSEARPCASARSARGQSGSDASSLKLSSGLSAFNSPTQAHRLKLNRCDGFARSLSSASQSSRRPSVANSSSSSCSSPALVGSSQVTSLHARPPDQRSPKADLDPLVGRLRSQSSRLSWARQPRLAPVLCAPGRFRFPGKNSRTQHVFQAIFPGIARLHGKLARLSGRASTMVIVAMD